MRERWKLNRFELRLTAIFAALLVFHPSLSLSSSLNAEGMALLKFRDKVVRDPFGALSNWNDRDGDFDHCFWFGVECTDGTVIILNLEDLCLEGTLAPELGKLTYMKSINLRNNSFSGNIPVEVADLKELEVLDLGYNNFSGPFPFDLGNNLSLSILLLDNNELLGSITPGQYTPTMLSEFQVHESQLTSAALGASCNIRSNPWHSAQGGDVVQRRLRQLWNNPRINNGKRHKRRKELFESSSLSPSSSPSQSSSIFSPPSSVLPPPISSPPESPSASPSPSFTPSPSPSPSCIPSPSPSPSFIPSPSPSPSPSFIPSPSPSFTPSLSPSPSPSPSFTPSPSPSPLHSFTPSPFFIPSPSAMLPPRPAPSAPPNPSIHSKQPANTHFPLLSSPPTASQSEQRNSKMNNNRIMIWSVAASGSLLLLFSGIGILLCRSSKMVAVKPWVTGLSGQLQKAFVTGVPKLERSELVTACEDFSNIIGSLSDGTVYKGTLSSGVEIAVASTAVKSSKDWPKKFETQFRKKIETLAKVKHKNFVNLIGFCEEQQPFTRMMIFEYAPNGTLFEHLHIMEAEHLDWTMRLRIAMGIAYCLEHMHQLTPPIAHANLHSSSIYLTEDYAAKLSDFSFRNDHEVTAAIMGSAPTELLETPASDPKSNVYSFGVILFEIVTGKMPYATGNGSVVDWASDYLMMEGPVFEMVDPILTSFQEEVLEKVFAVIKYCVHFDPRRRPNMKEVTRRLKEITALEPDGATPKSSGLWWAELEILSSESS